MIQKTKVVELTLKNNPEIAVEVATAVWFRCNPHQSTLIAMRLEEAGITPENLAKYFVEINKAVAEFWHNNHDSKKKTVLAPHELRGLYLPLMYGVIFASVGNITIGNYEYQITALDNELPDKDFLISFSTVLENNRDIVRGDIGQIGNRSAQPQTGVMTCLIGEIAPDGRSAEMLIRDGQQVDKDLAGLSVLVGVSLIEEANTILYSGVEEVNFRQLTDTLVDKDFMAMKKGNPSVTD